MTTIKIYNAEKLEENEYELINEHTAENNEECEKWAEENYGDTEQYAWAYC